MPVSAIAPLLQPSQHLYLPVILRQAPLETPRLQSIGQVGGSTLAVAVDSAHVFVGVGPRLLIFDADDRTFALTVGESPVLAGVVTSVAVSGNWAYVVAGRRLHILDVAEATHPRLVKLLDAPVDSEFIVAANRAYFLRHDSESPSDATASGVLQILDVSDPRAPRPMGLLELKGVTGRTLAVAGGLAFVVTRTATDRSDEALLVIDVAAPGAPRQLGTWTAPDAIDSIAAGSGVVYVGYRDQLGVIDVGQPAAPRQISAQPVTLGIRSLAVHNELLLATTVLDAEVYSVHDPHLPSHLGRLGKDLGAGRIAFRGDLAYGTCGRQVRIMDLSSPSRPQTVAEWQAPLVLANRIAVAGTTAYVTGLGVSSCYYDGGQRAWVVDLANPAQPLVKESISGLLADDLIVANDHLYATERETGVEIWDVSVPARPQIVGNLEANHGWRSMAIADHTLFLAGFDGLSALDVTVPTAPRQMALLELGPVRAVAAAGGFVYAITLGDFGPDGTAALPAQLHVVDIADPARPVSLAALDLPGPGNAMAVVGSLVFVAESLPASTNRNAPLAGLRIIDVTTPTRPRLGAFVSAIQPGEIVDDDRPYSWSRMRIAGDRAYVTDARVGAVWVVDVHNPVMPRSLGWVTTLGGAADLAVDGSVLYLADYGAGLSVLRNPFGDETDTSHRVRQYPRDRSLVRRVR